MTKSMNVEWSSIDTFVQQHHVDTIEFSKDHSVALCGGYELIEAMNIRVGELTVYVRNEKQHFVANYQLSCSGILDICWIDNRTAIVAQADGHSSLYNLDDDYVLDKKQQFKVADSILLSTKAIHDKLIPINLISLRSYFRFVFSDSNGFISLWSSDNCVESISQWKAHEFEVWCTTFDVANTDIIYSGGDDCNCCLWDYRQGFGKPALKFEHPMGVCSVNSVPMSDHVLSTGCYDKCLRLWDLRMISTLRPNSIVKAPLSKFVIDGGIWRHKWSPQGNSVLIAAMHKGFVFFSLDKTSSEAAAESSLVCFRPDAKLAYGVDWFFPETNISSGFDAFVATCSFYDNQVDFSKLTIKH